MEAKWIVEERERKLRAALEMPGLTGDQRDTVLRLDRSLVLEDRKLATRSAFVIRATRLGRFLGKPFGEATRGELESFLTLIASEGGPGNLSVYKQFLKAFYKRLLRPDEPGHPKLVSWIRLRGGCIIRKLPKDLLTRDEVKTIAASCLHPRDRAIVSVLYESAARASEFTGMHVADVAWDQYGARITLNGKTGPRTVRLINSVPDLRNWLDVHPHRGEAEAPLWVSLTPRTFLGPLTVGSLRDLVKRIATRAGVQKRVHPHLYRHSRITELAKHLSESELKVFAGWTPGSMMARVYVHLTGDDVDEKMLRHAGLVKDTTHEADPLATQECPRCHAKNSAAAAFCSTCTRPLQDPEADRIHEQAIQNELLKQRLPKLLALLEDPEVMALLAEKAYAVRSG